MQFGNRHLLSFLTALLILLYFLMFFFVRELSLQLANKVSFSLIRSIACLCQFSECLPSGPGSKLECSSSFAMSVPE